MTIKELAHHFYNKKEVDIDFCCLCSALLEFIDLKNGEDVQIYSDLSDDIEFALDELLNDYK